MHDDTRTSRPAPDTPHPDKRDWRRHTGTKLGHRTEVVEAMLLAGKNISEIARAVQASRHTVRAFAQAFSQRMQAGGYASPERVTQIRDGIVGRFALLADQSLTALDKNKLKEAGALELAKIADLAAQRAGLVESSSGIMFSILHQYNLQPSHSASRPTVDVSPPVPLPDSPKTS